MAGTKISDYATGGDHWSQLLTTIEKQRKGYNGISLTNYDNSSLPAIAAGSYVEISGALYGFTSEEAITGTPTSGSTNYIYIDGTTFVPVWTTTAPTWSDSKNGWYDTGEANRYVAGCYYDGTNYTGKWVYIDGRDILDNVKDGITYLKVAGINSSHKITNGSFNATGVWDYYGVPGGNTWVIPAGIYMMIANADLYLNIWNSDASAWHEADRDTVRGLVISDGTNYALRNAYSSGVRYVYYRKLD